MKIILVTGCPRSGTTAVGRMLGYARGAATLHEPFSPRAGMLEVEHSFEIPGIDLPFEALDRRVSKIRGLDLELRRGAFPADGRLKSLARKLLGGRTRFSYYRCKLQPRLRTLIWKDPMASFSALHLSTKHDIPVLFCLRNPWAVAASFKRMNWGHTFDNLAGRLSALGTDLPPAGFEATRASPVEKASILWHAIYRCAIEWAGQNENVHLLDLESVIENPVETYKNVYLQLGLRFDPGVETRIRKSYRRKAAPPMPARGKAHTRNRDLSQTNAYWRSLLGNDEREYVRILNESLWIRARKQAAEKWNSTPKRTQ